MSVLQAWGFPPAARCEPIVTRDGTPSVWLVEGSYYLKRDEKPSVIADLYTLSAHLARKGMPVAVPLLTRDGKPFTLYDGAAFFLRPRLEGDTLDDFDAIDWNRMAFTVGASAAWLHTAMADCPPLRGVPRRNMLWRTENESLPTLRAHGLLERLGLSEAALSPWLRRLWGLYPALPRQLVHYDLHGNNMLFRNGALCGVIDLDTCAYEARLFDPLYFTGWLLWRMGGRTEGWARLVLRTLQGYASIAPLARQEREAVPSMLLANHLYSAAVYLREGDEQRIARNAQMLRHVAYSLREIDAIFTSNA